MSKWKNQCASRGEQVATLNKEVSFSSPLNLFGLSEKIVAFESLSFIKKFLTLNQKKISDLLHEGKQPLIKSIIESLFLLDDLRMYLYKSNLKKLMNVSNKINS